MSSPDLHLETVDSAAPDATWQAIARHSEAIRAERLPEDPPLDAEALIAELRRPPSDVERQLLVVWENGEVVAQAAAELPLEQNTHAAFVTLSVLAPYRRRGLARRLMAELAQYAEARGRRRLLTHTSSRLPTGEVALRHLGAEVAMEQQFIQLELSELTPGLLTRWMAEAQAAAPQYRLWQHQGAYPAERLSEIADLQGVMNTAPSGQRDLQGWQTTPEKLRREDAAMRVSGTERLSTFAQHQPSGQLVAYTELVWQLNRPTLMFQHATAVRPEYRRHSLGRWIKAANLQAALSANPQARFVRAGNTNDNAGMLSINRTLGFQPHTVHTDWQMELGTLQAYLKRPST